MKKIDKKVVLKHILFAILIIESFFIVYFVTKANEKNKQLEERINAMEKANLNLINENNYLLNENERLGMINSEVWELFLAEHYVKEGTPYNE